MKRLLMICIAAAAMLSFTFTDTQADSPRMVVVEQFTATWCGPCGRYSPPFHSELAKRMDKVVPIIYHGSNDLMGAHNLPMYQNRSTFYGVEGIPYAAVNGGTAWKGNPGNLPQALAAIDGVNETSPYDLEVDWTRNGNSCNATVNLNSSESNSNLSLFVGVVEYHILNKDLDGKEAASNGETEFHWVARKLLPSNTGETVNITAGQEQNFNYDFNWSTDYKDGNIYVVAFLQNMTTKEIVQGATSIKMASAEIEMAAADQYSTAPRESDIEKTITVTNPNDFECDINLSADVDTDWTVSFSKEELTLPAGGSEEVTVTLSTDANAAFAIVDITATPANTPEGYVLIGANKQMMFLTEDAKYATLATSTDELGFYNQAVNTLNSDVKADWIVTDAGTVAEYYPDFDFDIVHVLVGTGDFSAWGVDGKLEGFVNDRIENQKHTIVSSNIGLWVHSGELVQQGFNPSTELKNLYDNVLGITLGRTLGLVQDNQLYQVGVVGEGNHEMTEGLTEMSVNSTYGDNQKYTSYAESIKLTAGSNAKAFLKYNIPDFPADEYAGVYFESGEGKTVYLGFPPQVIKTGYDKLMGNIVDWFMGDPVVEKEATIAVSDETVDFGSIIEGTTANDKVTIENTGDASLEITSVTLGGDDVEAFEIASLGLPQVVEPGTSIELGITFAPATAGTYNANVTIASNATNAAEQMITLTGTAESSSVYDEVSSMTVSPNPATDNANITLDTDSRNIAVNIFDMSGNLVKSFNASASEITWNLTDTEGNNVPAGTYLVSAGGKTVKVQVSK